MSADERLYKNIDEDEDLIEENLLKLQMMGFYEEKMNTIKEENLC